jgi:hypothetical protein
MRCTAGFFNPVRSLCTPGALEHLPDILGDCRCTLVIFRSARALGLLARIQALLGPRTLMSRSCAMPGRIPGITTAMPTPLWQWAAAVSSIPPRP